MMVIPSRETFVNCWLLHQQIESRTNVSRFVHTRIWCKKLLDMRLICWRSHDDIWWLTMTILYVYYIYIWFDLLWMIIVVGLVWSVPWCRNNGELKIQVDKNPGPRSCTYLCSLIGGIVIQKHLCFDIHCPICYSDDILVFVFMCLSPNRCLS